MAPLSLSALVVHLFEAVVALIVTPIDEDRSVIDAGAMFAPTFKSLMGLGQGGYGRSLPREIALGSVCAEDHGGGTAAVTITAGFVLSRIPDIKDADGSHKIELWSADIDVRAILNEPEGLVGGNKVIWGFWGVPSSCNWISGIARWKGFSRSSAVFLEERFKDAVCNG